MATQTQDANVVIKLHSKSYAVSKKDVAALHAAMKAAWKPTVRRLEVGLSNARLMWKAHDEIRSDSFLTARVIEKVSGAKFPPESLISNAEKSVHQLAGQVNASDFSAAAKTVQAAQQLTMTAADAVQKYHDAFCRGGDNCVSGLTGIRDTAILVAEVSVAIGTMGASVDVQIGAAAGLGSYKELLTQIEKAGGPDKGSPALALTLIIAAGARDGVIGHFMKDGAFGKEVTEYVVKKAGALALKKCTNAEVKVIVEKMVGEGLEEVIKTALTDLMNNLAGIKKMSLKEMLVDVGDKCFTKMAFAKTFGTLNKEIDKLTDDVFEKLSKSAIKGIPKLDDEKMKKAAIKIVEETLAKIVPKELAQAASSPNKLLAFKGVVLNEALKDSTLLNKLKQLKK